MKTHDQTPDLHCHVLQLTSWVEPQGAPVIRISGVEHTIRNTEILATKDKRGVCLSYEIGIHQTVSLSEVGDEGWNWSDDAYGGSGQGIQYEGGPLCTDQNAITSEIGHLNLSMRS